MQTGGQLDWQNRCTRSQVGGAEPAAGRPHSWCSTVQSCLQTGISLERRSIRGPSWCCRCLQASSRVHAEPCCAMPNIQMQVMPCHGKAMQAGRALLTGGAAGVIVKVPVACKHNRKRHTTRRKAGPNGQSPQAVCCVAGGQGGQPTHWTQPRMQIRAMPRKHRLPACCRGHLTNLAADLLPAVVHETELALLAVGAALKLAGARTTVCTMGTSHPCHTGHHCKAHMQQDVAAITGHHSIVQAHADSMRIHQCTCLSTGPHRNTRHRPLLQQMCKGPVATALLLCKYMNQTCCAGHRVACARKAIAGVDTRVSPFGQQFPFASHVSVDLAQHVTLPPGAVHVSAQASGQAAC